MEAICNTFFKKINKTKPCRENRVAFLGKEKKKKKTDSIYYQGVCQNQSQFV